MIPKFIRHHPGFALIGLSLPFATLQPVVAAEARLFEAESAQAIEAADKIADSAASAVSLISLGKPGQGVRFSSLPRATKLAIRYGSLESGTISVAVNDAPARKVNVHSSGALTGSFLHAIIDVVVPANATVVITRAANDVAINVDRILVGEGNLGLPPDIWSSSFVGSNVSIIAPKEMGAGKIEVRIDGQMRATADLATTGERQAQQIVGTVTGLAPGNHSIQLINRGGGPVTVDALLVR